MPYLTKWLLVLGVMLGGVIAVCDTSTATTGPGEKPPVLYAIPRAPEVKKSVLPPVETESGDQTESGEQPALEPTEDGQTLMPALDTADEMFDDAGPPYEARSVLDPFVPLIQEKPAAPSEDLEPDKPRRVLTPLEKMTLSQVKLVAVVMGENLKVAMVEDATGKGYEVRIGTYMGKNQGQVVDIQSDRILVREMVADFKGTVTERFEELKLHKADSGE